MDRFPSAAHLASWTGRCPGNSESGGERRSGSSRTSSVWLRTELTAAAKAAGRTKSTHLTAHQAQIKARRGYAEAVGATRHDILVAFYDIIPERSPFRELGPDGRQQRNSAQHHTRRLVRQLELDHTVNLEPVA